MGVAQIDLGDPNHQVRSRARKAQVAAAEAVVFQGKDGLKSPILAPSTKDFAPQKKLSDSPRPMQPWLF